MERADSLASRLRRAALRGGLVLAGTAVALGVVELTLWRMGYPLGIHPNGLFEEDPAIGYHRPAPRFRGTAQTGETPYVVAINEVGFRGPALQPRGEVEWRVLGLGDSFTFGVGVNDEDTYLRRLERILREWEGIAVEVLNGGVPGYGNIHELRYLESVGLAQDPDAVLLGFYAANDLSDNGARALRAVEGVLVPEGRVRFIDLKRWLRSHSRAYGLAANAVKRQQGLRGMLTQLGLVHAADPGMNAAAPGTVCFLKEAPPEVEAMWARAEEILAAMQERLKARRIPLVVVSIPDRASVDDRWMARAARQAGVPVSALDGAGPDRRLERFCQARGIPFLSLLPALRRASDTEPHLYFHYDGHWTAAGHRVAAEAIAGFLRAHPDLRRRDRT
jgi:lysophospholipase L1-like esterase